MPAEIYPKLFTPTQTSHLFQMTITWLLVSLPDVLQYHCETAANKIFYQFKQKGDIDSVN